MVLTIAHRGASYYYVENTRSAILAAITQHADMVEVDVRLTKDQKIVLFHDRSLLRLAKKKTRIKNILWHELREIPLKHKEHVMELEQFLDLIKGKIKANIDLKVAGCEASIIRAIKERHMEHQILLSSSQLHVLEQLKKTDPHLSIAYITRLMNGRKKHIKKAKELGCVSIHPPNIRTTQRFIKKIHAMHMNVIPHPVNSQNRMRYLIKAGVDGILTDRPDVLHHLKLQMGKEGLYHQPKHLSMR